MEHRSSLLIKPPTPHGASAESSDPCGPPIIAAERRSVWPEGRLVRRGFNAFKGLSYSQMQ